MKPYVRGLPLLGGLVDARLTDHREACLEVGLNVFLSTLPISLGALILLSDKATQGSWVSVIVHNLSSGELFLYATALMAPLFYFVLRDAQNAPRFPSRRFFVLFATAVLIVSVCLFSYQRADDLFGGGLRLDHEFVFSLSWKIYLAGIVVVYLAHVYRNVQDTGASRLMEEDTREFVKRFQDRHPR